MPAMPAVVPKVKVPQASLEGQVGRFRCPCSCGLRCVFSDSAALTKLEHDAQNVPGLDLRVETGFRRSCAEENLDYDPISIDRTIVR
jgi:hypothetical protein